MVSQVRYKVRKETRRAILHDSHTAPGSEFDADDGALRMGLLTAGYHYIIERDGNVVAARDRREIGSHTPGHNMDSIGICLVGGRSEPNGDALDNFTEAQRRSLLRLLQELRTAWPGIEIVGHTEVQRYRNRRLPPCPCLDMDLLREDAELFSKGYMLT